MWNDPLIRLREENVKIQVVEINLPCVVDGF